MFSLNEAFLEEIGLGAMPEEQKKPFLRHIYKQLEVQVGERLSEGMTDEQLTEFGNIIDRREEDVNRWLSRNDPDFRSSDSYIKLQQTSGLQPGSVALNAEYTAAKWLELNRPDYKNVVASTLESLKQEIIANKDAILG